MDIRTIILVTSALFLTVPAQAELYKWIDESGSTVYSETPPPAGAEVLTSPMIQAAPTPSSTPAATAPIAQSPERIAETAAQMTSESQARKTEAAERQTKQEEEKSLQETCDKLRANLETLKLQRRVFYYDESGEKVILDPMTQEKKARETEEKIKEFCQE